MNAIEIKDLRKTYGAVTAVDCLTLSVGEGELFALLGVNGAGKTTTIRMLTGLAAPTGGDALLCGSSIVQEPEAVKALSACSPQETAVAPNLTVRENLELMAGIYGVAQPKRAAETMIAEMNLGEVAARRARTLSGGWQRRLSIAMALITGPRVLFLDEPTLGLDVLARRALWEQIRALENTTVVLTTHYMEEAEALADRVGILSCGKLMAVGTPQELTEWTGARNFEDAFVALANGGNA